MNNPFARKYATIIILLAGICFCILYAKLLIISDPLTTDTIAPQSHSDNSTNRDELKQYDNTISEITPAPTKSDQEIVAVSTSESITNESSTIPHASVGHSKDTSTVDLNSTSSTTQASLAHNTRDNKEGAGNAHHHCACSAHKHKERLSNQQKDRQSHAARKPVQSVTQSNNTIDNKIPASPHITYPAIVCGVFFSEDSNAVASKIGVKRVASYTLKHWKNPADKFFSTLEKMSKSPSHCASAQLKYHGCNMPNCIVQMQLGNTSHEQARSDIINYIDRINNDGFFSSKEEHGLMKDIVEIILEPKNVLDLSKPNIPMIELLKELKAMGHPIYVLANVSHEVYRILKNTYPELLSICNGVFISSDMKLLKQDKRALLHIMAKTELKPDQLLIIDSEPDLIENAEQMGIAAISYKNVKDTHSKLKKHGICIQ